MEKKFAENFAVPPAEFHSLPFWAWNGKLTPEELRRQIRVMHRMGFGGFFMHSRVGLATPYLSDEWFACIAAATAEAERLGMSANLYDEDRWPSGAGGGFVTSEERFRMRYLEYEFVDGEHPATATGRTLGWFAVKRDGNDVREYRFLPYGDDASVSLRVRIFSRVSECLPWYNDTTYLDTLNPDAVDAFLASTHEKYAQRFQEKFGKSIRWMFTDEPNVMDFPRENRRTWTDRLPELFSAEYHFDMIPRLAELFFSCGIEFSAVRYGYYRLIAKLFAETFGARVGAWCRTHGLGLTGHLLREDPMAQQVRSVGAVMPFYRWMDMPGIDLLTEYHIPFALFKQVASAARQFGKKRVLSESYGCTGWDFSLFGHKAQGDLQYVLGINCLCHHLYWYTMDGEAKRDYPASIGDQSPWHEQYAAVEQYFARLGAAMGKMPERAPLLVIHPLETMWGRAGRWRENNSFDVEWEENFAAWNSALLGAHCAYDLGDESLLAEAGSVRNGMLRVGEAEYHCVLIPDLQTLRTSTLELLEAFADAGGRIFHSGMEVPYCDGMLPADGGARIRRLIRRCQVLERDNLSAEFCRETRICSIREGDDAREVASILVRVGEDGSAGTSLFAVNPGCVPAGAWGEVPPVEERKSDARSCKVRLRGVPAGRQVYELNAFSGKISRIPFEYCTGWYCWEAEFAAGESHLYQICDALPAEAVAETENSAGTGQTPLPMSLRMCFPDEPNLLVLDHAGGEIDKRTLDGETYILALDDCLRRKLNVPVRGDSMVQPWKRGSLRTEHLLPLPVELSYCFECKDIPNAVELVMEHPELYRIELNSQPQHQTPVGYWCDPALKTLPLDARLLRPGTNELRLSCAYHAEHPGLESIFLRGAFGVLPPLTLTDEPELRVPGDVTQAGLPYYAGNLIYCFEFDCTESTVEAELIFRSWAGSALAVRWDDGEWTLLFSPPWNVSAPRSLAVGEHRLWIKVYGHRRNALGPFYLKQRSDWTGPREFRQLQRKDKSLVPFGLLEMPELVCRA